MDDLTGQSQAPVGAVEEGGGAGGPTSELSEAGGAIGAEEEELLVARAQSLMDRVTAAPGNPSPAALHALASLLESQESRHILFSVCSSLP